MTRTIWMALALAVTASVGCKDSNPNYISFDAAPTQTTDARSDLPSASDVAADHGGSTTDVAADHGGSTTDTATDHGGSSTDAPASDAPADSVLAQDAASDATGPDTADATGDGGEDGGDGQ